MVRRKLALEYFDLESSGLKCGHRFFAYAGREHNHRLEEFASDRSDALVPQAIVCTQDRFVFAQRIGNEGNADHTNDRWHVEQLPDPPPKEQIDQPLDLSQFGRCRTLDYSNSIFGRVCDNRYDAA